MHPPGATADDGQSMSELDQLPSELEKTSFPPSCSSRWKLLIDLLCSLGLPGMVHFVLPRWWPRAIVRAERRPPRHSFTPPLGLLDLARSSSTLPPTSAPLLLSSSSVGRHADDDDNAQRSTLQGQVLVEVFTVYADFPFSGIITLFDRRASNYIYGRPDLDSRRKEHADSSEFKHELLLTGPGRAISAFGSFGVHVEIPATDEYYGVACDDYWDDLSKQNRPSTITIATRMDSLRVTYAVLSDAVQADLEVMVRLPWLYAFVMVHGHVTAYIGAFEVGTTLFSRDADEPEDVPFTDTQEGRGNIGSEFRLPLDRSPLVVPIGSCLHVKGELVLNGDETICIDHSMPTESDFFETGWWAEDDDVFAICTSVRLDLRYVWA